MAKRRITDLLQMKAASEKIAMLTCYEAGFAKEMTKAGVDAILVGDSLGMVVQGHHSTLPVTLEEMIYHTENIVRSNPTAFIVVDLPFGTYEGSCEDAFRAASALMKAGAEMVKLEGGAGMAEMTAFLTARGIPVCGHVGLLPQSVHLTGGYRVQGRDLQVAAQLIEDARAHQSAGAQLMVVECVPEEVGEALAIALDIPVIGIGAGALTDGQVLVMHDMLGLEGDVTPRFVKNFLASSAEKGDCSIVGAFRDYVAEVKAGEFPGKEHLF